MRGRVIFGVKELKHGGKRGRICGPKYHTRSDAQGFAKAMRNSYNKRFSYRVIQIKTK
jgi:hypothetical protein